MDREIVATRLCKLREALRHLKKAGAISREEYLASETEKALAKHFLRIALEAVLDLGNHVIAAEGLRKPLQLRDIPVIPAEKGILAGDLATKLAHAAGLRNRLVHGYADIDHAISMTSSSENQGTLRPSPWLSAGWRREAAVTADSWLDVRR